GARLGHYALSLHDALPIFGAAGGGGLDLAGPEAGFPASRFGAQFARARAEGLRVTIHAGEGDGPASIADALETGAERLGHGVRLDRKSTRLNSSHVKNSYA